MSKSNNKNNKNRGRQTRKPISFYDEIADPDMSKKTGRNESRNSKRDEKRDVSRSAKIYSKESKKGEIQKSNTNTLISTGLKKFYLIAGCFIVVCIVFTIFTYSCKANVDSQTKYINDSTMDIERELGESVALYNSVFSSGIEKAIIKEALPHDISTLTNLSDSKYLLTSGAKKPSEENMQKLQAEINKIVDKDNVTLSFCLIDILSQNCIYYNIDWSGPTFSCIKAPYTCANVCEQPELLDTWDSALYQAIKYSENSPYEEMWSIVGLKNINKWFVELGITDSFGGIEYPFHFTVRSMAKLWTKMYEQFNTNENIATYVSYYTHTKNSALDSELGEEYLVQSKAGWGDSTEDYTGYNDCGIVNCDKSPYVLCIFSGYDCDSEKLRALVRCLDNCHKDIATTN